MKRAPARGAGGNTAPRSAPVHGVVVIDKPRGPTSHEVVARVRRRIGRREIGHAGTLDPMATGVLVLAIGEATKLVPYLTAESKAYEATVALGVATDTLDADGRETERVEVTPAIRAAVVRSHGLRVASEVEAALDVERARTSQVPPAFSAIRKDGERAYERARRGDLTEPEARAVAVSKLRLLDAGDDPALWLALALEVTKGYYVRSLARDLAASLGTVGHLTSLRRTRSGTFTLDEALSIDTPADELRARILPLSHAATRVLPVAQLTDDGARDARFGRPVRPCDIEASSDAPHAWFDPNRKLVAIGERKPDGSGQVIRGFG